MFSCVHQRNLRITPAPSNLTKYAQKTLCTKMPTDASSHPSADLDEYFWLMISKRLARVLNADEFARRNGNDVILCEVLFDSSLVVFFIRGDARRLSFPTQRANDVPKLRYTLHGISTGYLDDPVLRADRQSRRAGHSVLCMCVRFEDRHFSKCACSERKTCTRSRSRPPI